MATERETPDARRPRPRDSIEDLVVVTNREPYRHTFADDASDDAGGREVVVDRPAGGLTAGLDPMMQRLGGTWIAWGDGDADFDVTDADDTVAVPPDDPAYTLDRLRLTAAEVEGYYEGYANQALWPLCHSEIGKVRFDDDAWQHYRRVNDRFAEAAIDGAPTDGVIWFQDYHFALAPRMVRSRRPDAFVMQFWHVPWPSWDVFRLCPQREPLLDGLLGNDLLGFHVPRYGDHFLDCVEAALPAARVDREAGTVRYKGTTTTVRAFPLGVDADDIRATSADADREAWEAFREEHGITADQVAIGVDRLDYTKGIPERLAALERVWERRPDLRGAFTYVQKGAESREDIPAYQRLQAEVEAVITRINERFGTEDWQPVVYTDEMYDHETLCALYRYSDLALVSPCRDGMNLVAQEYVAAQVDDDGVLLLSHLAGAHDDFGDAALTVNPYDTTAHADAIERALSMIPDQRHDRMHRLRRHVHEHDLSAWLDEVVETARDVRTSRAPGGAR